jgi:hypothetical protein
MAQGGSIGELMINEPAAQCNCEKYNRLPCFNESAFKALKYLYALISGRYAAAAARAPATPPWRQGV